MRYEKLHGHLALKGGYADRRGKCANLRELQLRYRRAINALAADPENRGKQRAALFARSELGRVYREITGKELA